MSFFLFEVTTILFLSTNVNYQISMVDDITFKRGDRRGPNTEIPGLKTRNPEVPKFEKKRIPGSRKGKSRDPELKNTRSRSPDKGPIPLVHGVH